MVAARGDGGAVVQADPASTASTPDATATTQWITTSPADIFDHYQPVTTGYAINSLGKAKWNLGCAHALNTYLHVLSPATVPLDPACR